MPVDLQQFRRQGYLILRHVVPPERLDAMRLAIEWMVDREKACSAAVRQPGDPLGGAWYEKIHPRLNINSIDAETNGFRQYLSPAAEAQFAHWTECYDQERDQIETLFRALIARDEPKFRTCLAELHPGEFGRMVSVVLLCRIANKVVFLHRPEIAQMSVQERKPLVDGSPPAYYAEDMARRFTVAEAEALQSRLAALNERLQQDEARVHQHYSDMYTSLRPAADPPNFESRPLRTFNSEMPAGFGVDEFVDSW